MGRGRPATPTGSLTRLLQRRDQLLQQGPQQEQGERDQRRREEPALVPRLAEVRDPGLVRLEVGPGSGGVAEMPPDEPADHHDDERNEERGSRHARITSCAAPARRLPWRTPAVLRGKRYRRADHTATRRQLRRNCAASVDILLFLRGVSR